jgi:hypothetical protein
MTDPAPDFLLRLRPVAGDALAVVRLRRLLKALLRSHGFRCVEIREAGREGEVAEERPDRKNESLRHNDR